MTEAQEQQKVTTFTTRQLNLVITFYKRYGKAIGGSGKTLDKLEMALAWCLKHKRGSIDFPHMPAWEDVVRLLEERNHASNEVVRGKRLKRISEKG